MIYLLVSGNKWTLTGVQDLSGLNVALNSFSVISQQRLVATGMFCLFFSLQVMLYILSSPMQYLVHILSPVIDNCPTWIKGRERMAVEMISWPISTKECFANPEDRNLWPTEN